MSYRIRFTLPDGRTGLWAHEYQTRETAQAAIDDRVADTGLTYAVEEASTPEDRIQTLEAELAQLRDAYDAAVQDRDVANRKTARAQIMVATAIDALTRAIEIGNAMHQASVPWTRVGRNALEEWTDFKATIAASLEGTAKASQAPGDGGDSDRRRLEALECYLDGDTFREIWKTSIGQFAAGTKFQGQHFDAPTLAALADKIAGHGGDSGEGAK